MNILNMTRNNIIICVIIAMCSDAFILRKHRHHHKEHYQDDTASEGGGQPGVSDSSLLGTRLHRQPLTEQMYDHSRKLSTLAGRSEPTGRKAIQLESTKRDIDISKGQAQSWDRDSSSVAAAAQLTNEGELMNEIDSVSSYEKIPIEFPDTQKSAKQMQSRANKARRLKLCLLNRASRHNDNDLSKTKVLYVNEKTSSTEAVTRGCDDIQNEALQKHIEQSIASTRRQQVKSSGNNSANVVSTFRQTQETIIANTNSNGKISDIKLALDNMKVSIDQNCKESLCNSNESNTESDNSFECDRMPITVNQVKSVKLCKTPRSTFKTRRKFTNKKPVKSQNTNIFKEHSMLLEWEDGMLFY